MGQIKTCTKCGELKALDGFHRDATTRTGRQSACKACAKVSTSVWQRRNHARAVALHLAWVAKNPGVDAKYQQKRRAANPGKARVYQREWRKANPDKVRASRLACRGLKNAANAARRAKKLQATVSWGNEFFIKEAYRLAKLRTKFTGIEWHVDHRVPLKSKLVCGLHNEFNLQVIPAKVNQAKSNIRWPDMP